MNRVMKSKIGKISHSNYFHTYEFDTILGKARISKASYQESFILWTVSTGEFRDTDFKIIYFQNINEAYKKLVELCDMEVDRVLKYVNFGGFEMNKDMKKELQSIKHLEYEYGYIALSDYKNFHYLSSLDKIIKLKEVNRGLCAKRKYLQDEVFVKSQSNGYSVEIIVLTSEISKLSEQIGKNGHKIQRLRTKYSQFGQKWIDSKCKSKDIQDICY